MSLKTKSLRGKQKAAEIVAFASEHVEDKQSYKIFLEEVEGLFREIRQRHDQIIKLKHTLGRLVIKQKDKMKWGQTTPFIMKLSKDLKRSYAELYDCVKAAERFPDFSQLQNKIDDMANQDASNFSDASEKKAAIEEAHSWRNVRRRIIYSETEEPRPKEESSRRNSASECFESRFLNGDESCFGDVTPVKMCGRLYGEFLDWLNKKYRIEILNEYANTVNAKK
jgi:hypothetical protein